MTEAGQDLDVLVDSTERIGVIGSPSSTSELVIDILGTAVMRKLVGELVLFRFTQDSLPHYALGQITEIELRNIWHEDPTMRSIIRQRGRVDAVSERQDTHLGKMVTSAVFQTGGPGGYQPSILGTVPSTGTLIHGVTDDVLDRLLHPCRDQIFYLGHVYGSEPKLPLWFKHFGRGVDGAGEAYHLGIFGKTGSGKSVLAKMILLAYARHPKMALLVIDPVGEFARDMRGFLDEGFPLALRDLFGALGKKFFVLSVRNLVLDRWELFREILAESRFFGDLEILTSDKRILACYQFTEAMKKARLKLSALHKREAFDKAWRLLEGDKLRRKIYASEGVAFRRFADAIRDADVDDMYRRVWLPVASLFREDREKGRRKVEDALNWLLNTDEPARCALFVDLSREEASGLLWNETIQALVIERLLDGLIKVAEDSYKKGAKNLNALVVIDEAHRLAPRDLSAEANETQRQAKARVRMVLADASRTTRKYGLGWLFISQTLSSLDTQILNQLRILFFGFGLALGQEFQALRQLVGSSGTALKLYQLFRDPHSAFDTASRQYSFMTIGPVSPLSFSGSPLFFNAFNTVEAFLEANRLQPKS